MEYRRFGRTGIRVSPLALGTMNFGERTERGAALVIIREAVESGINFIDTANCYNEGESERIVGQALEDLGCRERIFLATKVYVPVGDGPNDRGASRYHILRECERSLQRLRVDNIDLYQLHRPDFDTAPDETMRAFDDLVRAGKVRYIGCSTHPAWKIMEALAASERLGISRYVSEQPPYNLLDRRIENELVPLALAHELALIPWSPIAGGLLTGKYTAGGDMPQGTRGAGGSGLWEERFSDGGKTVGRKLAEYARERGLSAAQLALLWVKDQPGVTAPIIGPRTSEQLREAVAVMERRLDPEDARFCDSLVPPGTAVADFHNNSGWMKMRVGRAGSGEPCSTPGLGC